MNIQNNNKIIMLTVGAGLASAVLSFGITYMFFVRCSKFNKDVKLFDLKVSGNESKLEVVEADKANALFGKDYDRNEFRKATKSAKAIIKITDGAVLITNDLAKPTVANMKSLEKALKESDAFSGMTEG